MKSVKINITSLFLFVFGCFSISACTKEEGNNTKNQKNKTVQPVPSKTPAVKPTQHVAAADHPHHEGKGLLKDIMINLSAEMTSIQSALWKEDFNVISDSAKKIANHPHVKNEELKRIRTTLGDGFGSFIAMDKVVHSGAMALAKAADAKKLSEVVVGLSALQTGCVSCHSSTRERLTKKVD